MIPAEPQPLPPDDEVDGEYTGDFYEEDEPWEVIAYQMRHGTPFVTVAPPPGRIPKPEP